MREVTIITLGAGGFGYYVGLYEDEPALFVNLLEEGLGVGDVVSPDYPRELVMVLKVLNLEGLDILESALNKIRKQLEKQG